MLALVWDTNPGLTLALALLNLLQGGLPAARVWISKLLIDAVVAAVTTGSGTDALPEVILLVALQFAVGAAGNLLGTVSNICQQLLQEQVANRVQTLVMRQVGREGAAAFSCGGDSVCSTGFMSRLSTPRRRRVESGRRRGVFDLAGSRRSH